MPIDARIPLGVNPVSVAGSFQKGLLTRSELDRAQQAQQTGALNNQLLQAKISGVELENKETATKMDVNSMYQNLSSAQKFLDEGDIQGAQDYLTTTVEKGPTFEGSSGTGNSAKLLAEIQAGPQQGETEEQFKARISGKVSEDLTTLESTGYVVKPEVDDITKKRLEELRAGVRDRNNSIDEQIGFMKETKGTLSDLAKEIAKPEPNRSAVSSLFVKLVKSQDPRSAVLAGEMLAAMNLKGLRESFLKGELSADELGAAVGNEIAQMDPANINLRDVLNTADANLNSKATNILDAYDINEEAKGRLSRDGRLDLTSGIRDANIKDLRGGAKPTWYSLVPETEWPQDDEIQALVADGFSQSDALKLLEDDMYEQFQLSRGK